jgi:hypothetical protein
VPRGLTSEQIIEAIRAVERQKEISGYASAEAWTRLEKALADLDGKSLPPSVTRRLKGAFQS